MSLDDRDRYPVFNFACTNAHAPMPFQILTASDYLLSRVSGDFTPVFNVAHRSAPRYPIYNFKAGVEHLLWWPLAEHYGIPSWATPVVQVNPDADLRMTSPQFFADRAADFALMQSITLDLMKTSGWNIRYPSAYKKRARALLLYALAAGNTQLSAQAASELPPPEKLVTIVARTLPSALFRWVLYWLKRYTLRHSHHA